MFIKHSEVRLAAAPNETIATPANGWTAHRDEIALQFEHAMRRFESAQWAQAFIDLRALADRGHPPAARIALMLVCRGKSLFGGTYAATREQRARWHRHGLS